MSNGLNNILDKKTVSQLGYFYVLEKKSKFLCFSYFMNHIIYIFSKSKYMYNKAPETKIKYSICRLTANKLVSTF